jgi:hypothetical protein
LANLSNELIYEIFEFLHPHQAFQAFYDLNKRFENLFVYSNLRIKINIISTSKSAFQRYITHYYTTCLSNSITSVIKYILY